MQHATAIAGGGKRQAWLPTNHIEKLLEESFPSNAQHVKHKLRDCSTMKSFMT
jgi:hypothetical protein